MELIESEGEISPGVGGLDKVQIGLIGVIHLGESIPEDSGVGEGRWTRGSGNGAEAM